MPQKPALLSLLLVIPREASFVFLVFPAFSSLLQPVYHLVPKRKMTHYLLFSVILYSTQFYKATRMHRILLSTLILLLVQHSSQTSHLFVISLLSIQQIEFIPFQQSLLCPNQIPPRVHGNHCHQAGRLQSDKLECSQGYYRFGTSLTEPIQEPILLRQYSVLTRSNIL